MFYEVGRLNGVALPCSHGVQNLAWDAENRLTSITEGGNTITFVYDGELKVKAPLFMGAFM